jgi:integrase
MLQFRIGGRGGKQLKKKLGIYPSMTPEEARALAKQIKAQGTLGVDIIAENKQKLAAEKARQDAIVTMNDLADSFRNGKAKTKKSSSVAEDERRLTNRILPKFGDRDVASITRKEIDLFHKSMSDTPYEANRTLALLSTMFNIAILDEVRSDNPIKGIDRFKEKKRERYLNDEEAGRLEAAMVVAETDHYETVAQIRLLLLSGARRNELLEAKWEDFDFPQLMWNKPDTKTGAHTTPINTVAAAILLDLQQRSGRRKGDIFTLSLAGRVTALKRLWKQIQEEAGFRARIHDLRHNFASLIASNGGTLYEISKLLGHASITTTQRYAHLFPDTLRTAVEKAVPRAKTE